MQRIRLLDAIAVSSPICSWHVICKIVFRHSIGIRPWHRELVPRLNHFFMDTQCPKYLFGSWTWPMFLSFCLGMTHLCVVKMWRVCSEVTVNRRHNDASIGSTWISGEGNGGKYIHVFAEFVTICLHSPEGTWIARQKCLRDDGVNSQMKQCTHHNIFDWRSWPGGGFDFDVDIFPLKRHEKMVIHPYLGISEAIHPRAKQTEFQTDHSV